MQRLGEMPKHRPQPQLVGHDAGEITQLAPNALELGVDPLGRPTAGLGAGVPIPVKILHVVEHGDRLLGGDLGGEPRG